MEDGDLSISAAHSGGDDGPVEPFVDPANIGFSAVVGMEDQGRTEMARKLPAGLICPRRRVGNPSGLVPLR